MQQEIALGACVSTGRVVLELSAALSPVFLRFPADLTLYTRVDTAPSVYLSASKKGLFTYKLEYRVFVAFCQHFYYFVDFFRHSQCFGATNTVLTKSLNYFSVQSHFMFDFSGRIDDIVIMKSAKAQSKQLSGPGRFYLRFRRRETEGPAIIKEIVMFTKQHYKAIAAIIAGNTHRRILDGKPHNPTVQKSGLVASLANYFADDNPKFDRQKFLDACGVD